MEGDDGNVIFPVGGNLGCLGVATEYKLQKIIGGIASFTDLIVFKSVNRLNFPARRVFRHAGMDVIKFFPPFKLIKRLDIGTQDVQ